MNESGEVRVKIYETLVSTIIYNDKSRLGEHIFPTYIEGHELINIMKDIELG
jgi:hypothetical protein